MKYERPAVTIAGSLNEQLGRVCITVAGPDLVDPRRADYALGTYVWARLGNRGQRQLAVVTDPRPRTIYGERFWRVELWIETRSVWSGAIVERRIARALNRVELERLRAARVCT